ncbi:hypothetical protein Vretifemale_5903 [Volvox reticuliferus]|nr:hypothetical protein Vretifemale_5903 [Volvox reticuliferus]
MVRSSRPAPIVAGAKGTATSEAANTCPGSPGGGRYSTRKLQPMLSLQPQKSILKSSSLKRRALETDPIFIKVASARLGVITHELTNTAASTADIAGAGSDCEELNLDNRAAPLAMTMSEGGTSDSPAPGTASTASMRPNLTSPLRSSVPDLQAARATGDISARVEAIAAEVATADDPQSQLWSMFSSENIPSSGPMSPKAAVGRLEPRISVVTAKGSTAAPGAAGWFLDSALNGSGTPSPAVADSGYRALMKSTSFKLTTQAGTMGQTLLASVDTPASGGPGSVPRGGSGRAVALSTSGYPNIGPTNGGEGAGGGGGGGSCDGAQPSIVQRITRQLSRGAGGSLGGGSSPKDATGSPGDIRGGNSPMGRSTPRNAVLPLPPMMLMPNSTGGGGNAAESQPLPPTPTRMASLRHSAAGDPACLMTAGSQPETPSYPSSPSHQESLRYRRLAGRSSKLAAGVGGYEPSKQDGFDNLLHGKPERMTSTAQQGMIGTLTLASELPEPLMASDSRRRRVTTGGLQPTTADESDTDTIRYMVRGSNGRVGDSGTRDSSKPAGPESSRWRLQIMKAVKERTDSSPAEAPLPVHPEGASLIADDGPTPRQVRPVRGGTDDFPGTLGDLTPSMATAATRFQDGDKTQPLAAAAAAGRGHKGAAAIDSSSSTSLEDSTTGIATSLRATVDPGSQIGGDIKDSDDGHGDDDEEDCTAWRVGDGEETPGEWKNLDKAEAREMIAAELLRMQTFAADSKVQVDNRETEAYQPPKAGAPLLPSGPLQQQVTLAAQNRNESPKGMAASAAPAAADDVDASGGAIATDAQEVPDAAPPPSSRFRLTKFHSLGRGAAKAVLQPSTAAGSYLSAAMLRASAAAALDNVRRVSCNDGAAGLLAATATVAAAKLIPAGGASAGGAAVASSTASTDPARLFVAIPQDSLESWVHNHSRRFTAERGCAAPLGPLDPLDELSEVTGFRTSATPPPPPPPAATAAGETTPAAMPFQWATAPQALHRGARLVPEPEVLQVWLSRNGSSMMERGADLQPHQQDSRHGGGGAGAAVPVMRQSLPGNVRLGVKM